MTQHNTRQKQVEKTHQYRVLAVTISLPDTTPYEIEEFHQLVRSTGAVIVEEITGKRETPLAHAFIGRGKAQMIAEHVEQSCAELIIFNHPLSATQEKNLEALTKCRVLDRNGLILDIFARRARSFEGKLQVELAQLERLSTRLIRGWTHLERQRGGIGLRGPGETQLETDRRLIRHRIKAIQQRLRKVRNQRHQGRRARQRAALPMISLVGYTNSGKSTLFNALTGANTYVADQLFATLDPTLRTLQLPGIGNSILIDTVGFMSALPHDLVEAFQATLEETRESNLLLHVIDAHDTHTQRTQKIRDVEHVLHTLNAQHTPMLEVYNKSDQLPQQPARIERDERGRPRRIWLSAKSGHGLDLLYQAVADALCHHWVHCSIKLSTRDAARRAQLYELNAVLNETPLENGDAIIEIRLAQDEFQRLIQRSPYHPR